MNISNAVNEINARATQYLQRDRSGKGWICPICKSGSGRNGTGITTKDNIHFTCWAGCFSNATIIDIIGKERGLDSNIDMIKAACDVLHITIDEGDTHTQMNTHNTAYTTTDTQPERVEDYSSFFLEANKALDQTDYYRGISLETLNRFYIGFVKDWKHPKSPKMTPSPRLIIPTSKSSYLARYAGQGDFINYRGSVENKSKVGKVRIFNDKALKKAEKPIFVVEGEIDALSIIDVGGEAIGLGSISNVDKLLKLMEDEKPVQPLIIAFDNDADPQVKERVEAAEKRLCEGLERLGIAYTKKNVYGEHKDANEALCADREALKDAVEDAESFEDADLYAEQDKLQREAALYKMSGLLQEIKGRKDIAIPTGFTNIDSLLDGGLFPGLYVIGAVSSLGKTSFCLQLCDQVAKNGRPVLIFSLEMAAFELMAKSISRHTFLEDLKLYGRTQHAKSTRGILTGARYDNYTDEEMKVISSAMRSYSEYADYIWITEGVGDVTITKIREKVKRFIDVYKVPPLVLVDYLQIISPYNERFTDKQNTDKSVIELKRLSRDFKIPVIAISSFNRMNYDAPVNMASFKESGAVEYSADVLIGLQYAGMDDVSDLDQARKLQNRAREDAERGEAQNIQFKVLKNRNGRKGSTELEFYPMFNYFCETEKPMDDNNGWSRRDPSKQEEDKQPTNSPASQMRLEDLLGFVPDVAETPFD